MLLDEFNILVKSLPEKILTVSSELPSGELVLQTVPDVVILTSGDMGPIGPVGLPGAQGIWISLTQAEYDALDPPDPAILYVIVG